MMTGGPITDKIMQTIRYTTQQHCRVKYWHMTEHELDRMLDELYFWPHEKARIKDAIANGDPFKAFHATVKLIPSTPDRL